MQTLIEIETLWVSLFSVSRVGHAAPKNYESHEILKLIIFEALQLSEHRLEASERCAKA